MARGRKDGDEAAELRRQLATVERERQQLFAWLSRVERERAELTDTLPMAAHQLLAPVQVLLLSTDALRACAAADAELPRAWLADHAGKMRRQLERIEALLRASIEIWRGQLHPLEPQTESDLVATVRTVVAAHRDDATEAGCAIDIAAPAKLVGPWDGNKLRFVVAGLVSNAIRHGRGAPVRIELADGGSRATLRVSDEGPGFDADVADRLFHPFARHGAGDGFGLGLWIVQQLVTALGGTVTGVGAPGRGALFTVVLRKSAHAASARRRRRGTARARTKELP